jgi:hypothetical protein
MMTMIGKLILTSPTTWTSNNKEEERRPLKVLLKPNKLVLAWVLEFALRVSKYHRGVEE